MTTTGPRTFDTRTTTGPITRFLVRVRAWLESSDERRARRAEQPHDGWSR